MVASSGGLQQKPSAAFDIFDFLDGESLEKCRVFDFKNIDLIKGPRPPAVSARLRSRAWLG